MLSSFFFVSLSCKNIEKYGWKVSGFCYCCCQSSGTVQCDCHRKFFWDHRILKVTYMRVIITSTNWLARGDYLYALLFLTYVSRVFAFQSASDMVLADDNFASIVAVCLFSCIFVIFISFWLILKHTSHSSSAWFTIYLGPYMIFVNFCKIRNEGTNHTAILY